MGPRPAQGRDDPPRHRAQQRHGDQPARDEHQRRDHLDEEARLRQPDDVGGVHRLPEDRELDRVGDGHDRSQPEGQDGRHREPARESVEGGEDARDEQAAERERDRRERDDEPPDVADLDGNLEEQFGEIDDADRGQGWTRASEDPS